MKDNIKLTVKNGDDKIIYEKSCNEFNTGKNFSRNVLMSALYSDFIGTHGNNTSLCGTYDEETFLRINREFLDDMRKYCKQKFVIDIERKYLSFSDNDTIRFTITANDDIENGSNVSVRCLNNSEIVNHFSAVEPLNMAVAIAELICRDPLKHTGCIKLSEGSDIVVGVYFCGSFHDPILGGEEKRGNIIISTLDHNYRITPYDGDVDCDVSDWIDKRSDFGLSNGVIKKLVDDGHIRLMPFGYDTYVLNYMNAYINACKAYDSLRCVSDRTQDRRPSYGTQNTVCIPIALEATEHVLESMNLEYEDIRYLYHAAVKSFNKMIDTIETISDWLFPEIKTE